MSDATLVARHSRWTTNGRWFSERPVVQVLLNPIGIRTDRRNHGVATTMKRVLAATLAVLALGNLALAQTASPRPSGAATGRTVTDAAGLAVPPSTADSSRAFEIPTMTVQQMVRIEGTGESQLRGMGLVTGLRGTGDSGAESVLARPLAELYKNNGNPIPNLKELAKSKAVAIVSLWANIPEEGARKGDKFDVYVKVSHTATSIEGGMLEIAPVLGPRPGQGAFGFASGIIKVNDPTRPTVGIIHEGLQLFENIVNKPLEGRFNLIVRPYYRGWSTTNTLAQQINDSSASLDDQDDTTPQIAKAIDEMTVQITVPEFERNDPANFIANLLAKRISPELMRLPAQIICNERTGVIVATGNVEISTVAIAHKDLVVTTTTPQPTPTSQDPIVSKDNWVSLQTAAKPSDRAKVQDLLSAFKQLDVPIRDQIDILKEIHRSGRLHARLILE